MSTQIAMQVNLEHIGVAVGRHRSGRDGPAPLVRVEGQHIVICDRHADGREEEIYDIPVAQMQTALGVSFWFRQLSQKTWVTTRHLYLLSSVVHGLHEVR